MVHRLLQHYLDANTTAKKKLLKKNVDIAAREKVWPQEQNEIVLNTCKLNT